ncbi:hypothetical protein EMCRGX_G025445 [Ephydatia muelleri]
MLLVPTLSVRIDPDADAPVETTPVVVEDDGDGIDYASQAHILKVLELMDGKDEHEHSVRRLPHIDIRHQVECANEIGAGTVAAMEVPVQHTELEAEDHAQFVSIPLDSTILTTIRDVLKCICRITLLKLSDNYALRLLFQAKVDRLYLTHGVRLEEYCETHSRVPRDSVTFAWKELKNVYAMRSLVLKQDVATMYKGYVAKQRDKMPGKRLIGRTLFYSIAKHITGGGRLQEARAGVDYIKVNFHTDNFTIIDKVIVLGVKASDDAQGQFHRPQEHNAQQFDVYDTLETLVSEPDAFDEPATQQAFVKQVQDQLIYCAQARGTVVELSEADSRLDEDPTRQAEIADVLLTVRQCERCTFRYMAHVMLAVQQAHKMKQAVSEMDSSTAYMVFDFKQKFLAKDTGQDDRSTEFIEEHHVEIDFTAEKVRLRQQVEMVNIGNVQDDDDEDVVDDDSEEDREVEEDNGVKEDGVGEVEEDNSVKEDDREDGEEDGVVEGKEEVGMEEISEEEDGADEDGEEVENFEENDEEDGEEEEDGEQKADGNVVLSCLEAVLHALKQRFPHVSKIIIQSDNAKNLAGKQTKLLLPHVCSAAGLKLVAYHHNEAQSGKNVCDTHFSHQQTQVDAYLVKGNGGRKVSTPKQLAVALVDTSVSNTTVIVIEA